MGRRESRRVDPDALERGLERIFVPPRQYADLAVDVSTACRLLRCEESAIAALVRAGLPAFDEGGERFRRCDVLNVGLYSGSGRTVPELAEAHRVRFAAEPPDRWTESRDWRLAFDLGCGRDDCEGASWALARPVPERFGGVVLDWPETPLRSSSPLRLGATVTTRGARGAIAPAAARELFLGLVDDLVRGRLRYQYLPPRLRRDPETAVAGGVLDCMAASLLLAGRCRERGLEVRTRKGLLLGTAAVEHVWVEALGEDGVWAPLDPVLAALVARAGAGEGFVRFACGSVTNRLLPWDLDAGQSLLGHICSAGEGPPRDADELLVTISASTPLEGRPRRR